MASIFIVSFRSSCQPSISIYLVLTGKGLRISCYPLALKTSRAPVWVYIIAPPPRAPAQQTDASCPKRICMSDFYKAKVLWKENNFFEKIEIACVHFVTKALCAKFSLV